MRKSKGKKNENGDGGDGVGEVVPTTRRNKKNSDIIEKSSTPVDDKSNKLSDQQAKIDKYKELQKALAENEILWGMYYCGHYFKKDSPTFHLRILKDCKIFKQLAVQAPRKSAKSTLLGTLKPTHGICNKQYKFIIIVQNTKSNACETLQNIKAEFKDNERIATDYKIKLSKDTEEEAIFVHPNGFKTRVLCKGADQIGSIRGKRYRADRPDLILIDDLEDDELVRNPERRKNLQDEFDEVIKFCGDTDTQFIVIGTILHDDGLMAKLVSPSHYKRWRKLFFKARFEWKGEIRSLWPASWSVEDLNEMERENPAAFAKEMQGDPSSGDLETIRRDDFRYWEVRDGNVVLLGKDGVVASKWSYKDLKPAIALDLAWEDKKVSDFSVVVPGFCTPHNDILIESYVAKRGMRPDELEEILFSMSLRMERLTGRRVQIGMEKAKLEKVMKWFLSEAQRRRNQWLWMKDVSWGTKDKVERVLARLGNRYAQHSIYHRTGMGDLENQLIRIRSVAHDDIADAVSMLPELLAFAPGVKKPEQKDDMFKFLQKQTPGYKDKNRKSYMFGQGKRPSAIKVVQGI